VKNWGCGMGVEVEVEEGGESEREEKFERVDKLIQG
jgi:hypothetical protein